MLKAALYIHIPWCIRKCPYCDFNSHKSPNSLPEREYIEALISDLQQDLERFSSRQVTSIFIGGGTPSLFSAQSFENLLNKINKILPFSRQIEITMEANPGTVEQQRFQDYRQVGINRLSLGIQSFNNKHLKTLGRIHDGTHARKAIELARKAGFDNINLDLMHSLPNQTTKEAVDDLQQAITYNPEHLSWYQLTLEPNTVFYKQQPSLPKEEITEMTEEQGYALLQETNYIRYEISAFSKPQKQAQHNLNYWLYGDYYGIGAGAHGKITSSSFNTWRTVKYRQPKDYLNPDKGYLCTLETVEPTSLPFEFILNTSRLQQAIPNHLLEDKTGLNFSLLAPKLQQAHDLGLIELQKTSWKVTEFGRRFTNELQALFLP